MDISDEIRRFVEDPESFTLDPPLPGRRFLKPNYTLVLAPTPTQSTVCNLRTSAADLDAVIAEIRGVIREAGYSRTVWAVGPSSRPEGAAGMLRARGFVPATDEPFEPLTSAMLLAKAPPAAPAGIETRQSQNEDDFVQGVRILTQAFSMGPEDTEGWVSAAPKMWAQQDPVFRTSTLAFLDGKPVGFGFNQGTPYGLLLGGSGVLPEARGRGAYRALIAARWQAAVDLGKPAVVVHAGAMSRPILERCGFERVCQIEQFDDPTPTQNAP